MTEVDALVLRLADRLVELGHYKVHMRYQTRRDFRATMDAIGLHTEDDIRNRGLDSIYQAIAMTEEKPPQRTTMILVNNTNKLFLAVDRHDMLQMSHLHGMTLGKRFSKSEREWMVEAELQGRDVSWYADFKQKFVDWIQSRADMGTARMSSMVYYGSFIVRCSHRSVTDITNIQTVSELLVRAVVDASKHDGALLKRKRGHRSGDAFNPMGTLLDNYRIAAVRLAEFLKLPVTELIGKAEAKRRAEATTGLIANGSLDIEPVDDVLTDAEMERAIQSCQTDKERLVINLLCRLGMRIGAIASMRPG